MTSMQFVKKMVLIPYDEYNSWKDSKKLEINSSHQSPSLQPDSHQNLTSNAHSDKLHEAAGVTQQTEALAPFKQVTDNTYKELVSKIGSTLLDLILSKGAKSIQNIIGSGEEDLVAPPPGEPDSKKRKRELSQDKPSPPTVQQKQSSLAPDIPKLEVEKTLHSHNMNSGLNPKATWKHLR